MKKFKLPKNNTHFEEVELNGWESYQISILNSGMDQRSQELPAIYLSQDAFLVVGKLCKSNEVNFNELK